MEELQKREEKGKEGLTIKYDKDVINNKDTDIIFNVYTDEDTKKQVALFILKYKLNVKKEQIPYQVVLGMIGLEKNSSHIIIQEAKIIRDFLLEQLKKNVKGNNVYDYCKKLDQICMKENIPFIYTKEGIEILTADREGEYFLDRTYKVTEKDGMIKSKSINSSTIMDLQDSRECIKEKMDENIKRTWMINTAIKELTEEEKNKFIIGKNIDELRREDSVEVILEYRRNIIIDNMKAQYNKREEKTNEQKISFSDAIRLKKYLESKNIDRTIDSRMIVGSPEETTEMEKYFRLKEKAIAIDIKKMLEDIQNEDIEHQIETGIVSIDKEKENYINECKNIFDLIKQGRDVNAQFCYSRLDKGFENLELIIREQLQNKDKNGNYIYNQMEIKKYLHLKEQIFQNVKLDKGNNYLNFDVYAKNPELQDFVTFVLYTDVRKDTEEEEKKFIANAYKDLIERLITRHSEEVKLYNDYAEKYGIDRCPLPIQIEEKTDKSNEESFKNAGEDR